MCGIAGIVGESSSDTSYRLTNEMITTMRHRGPDDTRVWSEPGIGMACARLALIGGDAARQPMCSPDGRFVLAYNGEVFNHGELRIRPEVRAWPFRTPGDTEVVLALLSTMGPRAFRLLNGQFAGALYDRELHRLLLFRDRFGILPIYFAALAGGRLAFASTIRALALLPGVDLGIDTSALRQVTAFWTPIAPVTAVRGVRQLPPSGLAEFRDGHWHAGVWQPDCPSPCNVPERFEDQVSAVTETLRRAVTRRLKADHPVAVLVSGGVDSAITAALATWQGPVRSWSVAFDDSNHDESPYQRTVARALATEHQEVRCSASALAEILPDVVISAESPFLRLTPAATYLLGEDLHSGGIRAVISGEGADEAFFGYDVFKEALLLASGSADAAAIADAGLGGTPAERHTPSVAALMLNGCRLDTPLASHAIRWRAEAALRDYLRPEVIKATRDPFRMLVDSLPAEFAQWSPLRRAQHLEMTTLLPGYLLATQADRMLMAHSVEARYPFLDNEVFDLAAALPDDAKLLPPVDKRVLRAAAAHLIPASIASRPKQAYRAPVAAILRTPTGRELADDLLSPDRVRAFGFFAPKRVSWLADRLRSSASLSNTQEMALACVITTHLLQHGLHAATTRSELIA
jgi:asparagine synthase (glutamine-hydrolysing)